MKRVAVNLAKFRALPWPEQRTLLAAMAWLPLFGLALRILGLRRLQAWLQRGSPGVDIERSFDEIVRIATLVNTAGLRLPLPPTCLTRSLLLGWLLRRRGVASQLRIGVRLAEGAVEAHAWVECAGVPINDRPDVGERFAPFAEILPAGAFHSP
ncbi:MAG: lasso peptide biosynthesis B2 protein [Burkholderiales bacterium]|nr:lasso peptide biosynthesis B2 protein [Burkholderiales bacterium]